MWVLAKINSFLKCMREQSREEKKKQEEKKKKAAKVKI